MSEFAFSDAPIGGSSSVSKAFKELGIDRFHQALKWLKDLEYGDGGSSGPMAVFQDSMGTCASKHGTAAMLAQDCGLRSICKFLSYYPLDETRFRGARSVLDGYDLPFVPNCHCVLVDGCEIVDLTLGNNTGKLRDIEEFDMLVRVEPFPSKERYDALLESAVRHYQDIDDRLASASVGRILEVRLECLDAHRSSLEKTAKSPVCGC